MMLNVLSISLSMSFVILLLTILRSRINDRYCAKVMCILWMIAAIRMVFPVRLDFPFYQPVLKIDMSQEIVELPSATLNGTEAVIQLDHELSDFTPVGDPSTIKTQHQTAFTLSLEDIIKIVWLIGTCGLLSVNVVSYISVSRWLRKHCKKVKEIGKINIYSSKNLPESFAFGIFRPAVYLSKEALDDKWVLNHELIHCKHRDGMMQALMCLVKCMHWFNPFVYLMEKQWEADREINCDETVLKDKSKSERIDYMLTLYNAAESMMDKKLRFTSGLLDGEHQMVERFKMIRTDRNKRTGKALVCVLCISILVISSLVGCTSSERKLVNEAIDLIQSEHVQSREIMMSKVMDEDGLGYSNGKISFDEVNFKYQKLNEELDSLRYQVEKLNEQLKTNHSKEEFANITSVIFQLNDEISTYELALEALTQEINSRKEEYMKTVVDILEKMNLKKIDKLEVVENDSIPLNVAIKLENGNVLKMQFYESGQLVVSMMDGVVKTDVEVYKYQKEVFDLFHALMQYHHQWGFLEASGGLSVEE